MIIQTKERIGDKIIVIFARIQKLEYNKLDKKIKRKISVKLGEMMKYNITVKEIYNILKSNDEILKIYKEIEKYEIKNKGWAFHNYEHIKNVSDIAEKILIDLNFDESTIYKCKIACILHDIGALYGKEGHAQRGYEFSKLEDTNLSWKEVYDYYNMPTFKNNVYYLEVGQGSDGDYNGGDSIKYYSYTGLDWSNQKIEKETREELDKKFDERVANRSDKIFLKDFNNYKPQNNDIKISQQEAEKIAEIGFEEASSIGESGSKTSQNVQVEQRTANNFFVMNHNCIHEVYQNILRKCYVFTRENDMGCGSSVYVDVTTGLIIGGECFGD